MCIKDRKMTNSEVLQFIIEELSKTHLTWESDKELFELICDPLSYASEAYHKRKIAKQEILHYFQNYNNFDIKRFHKLADNIVCGENETLYRKELADFLYLQAESFGISSHIEISQLVSKIPCKSGSEKNYRSNFNNWKNGNTSRINRREIKHRLEQNFFFQPSLWDQGEYIIKQTIRDGVLKFVKKKSKETAEMINIFEALRKEFDMYEKMNEEEQKILKEIAIMNETEMMDYIGRHYPLNNYHTQEFIQELIPILYHKGFYELLLDDIFSVLDIHFQESHQIKKIKAHIYGSSKIGKYKKAFDILSTIKTDNDLEKIDIQTEAISNMKRDLFRTDHKTYDDKKEIINILIEHYRQIFYYNDTFHYYPAINLTYMTSLASILSHKDNIIQQVHEIHTKCQTSLKLDLKSDNIQNRFYANMTQLEFGIIKGNSNPLAELERFLEIEEDEMPYQDLLRSQRQMQFFLDALAMFQHTQHSLHNRIQNAVEIIDDFIEFRKNYSL